jgi:hypothetical protein
MRRVWAHPNQQGHFGRLRFSLPLKNFPAFGFPRYSVLHFREIHTKLFRDVFKRQFGIIRCVVAGIRDHFYLFAN